VSWVCLSSKFVKAKKRYKCSGCYDGWIEVGECHDIITGVMEGDFCSDRYHPECLRYCFQDGNEDGIHGNFSRKEATDWVNSEEQT